MARDALHTAALTCLSENEFSLSCEEKGDSMRRLRVVGDGPVGHDARGVGLGSRRGRARVARVSDILASVSIAPLKT